MRDNGEDNDNGATFEPMLMLATNGTIGVSFPEIYKMLLVSKYCCIAKHT